MTKKPKKLTTTSGNDYFHVSVGSFLVSLETPSKNENNTTNNVEQAKKQLGNLIKLRTTKKQLRKSIKNT